MTSNTLFPDPPKTSSLIVPRAYQTEAHDEAFRQFDKGIIGTLVRLPTGSGKTVVSCMMAETWLSRGDEYRVMVLSYEKQLVWQFAQEIEDFTGITPGIEMEREATNDSHQIVVASRQSLVPAKPPAPSQIDQLETFGITDLGACPKHKAASMLRMIEKGAEPEVVKDEIWRLNQEPEANGERWGRLFKFDWKLNWLLLHDEAHKWAYKLATTHPIVDWFEQNPDSRRCGLTATPKRFDGVSIGAKMFPGIAIDYPLFSRNSRCAVKDGYSVPYVQKYISVEGVDFKQIKKLGNDFDEAELDRILGEEETLAKLCNPMLELVGNRRTLIFSPSVDMAKNVAQFINARWQCECGCGTKAWYPSLLIGDGAKCRDCGDDIDERNVLKRGVQAHAVWGSVPPLQRKEVYQGHQSGAFQFLSVCGLCLDSESLILTDCGEVPIKDVTRKMKLWDGIEFVSHDGVIFQGTKPVIEYAGLKATEDHNVWTENGWKRLADCKEEGLPIAVGGIEGAPVREAENYYRTGVSPREISVTTRRGRVHRVRQDDESTNLSITQRHNSLQVLQYEKQPSEPERSSRLLHRTGWQGFLREVENYVWQRGANWQGLASRRRSRLRGLRGDIFESGLRVEKWQSGMQAMFQAVWCTKLVADALSRCKKALREFKRSVLRRLRWTRNCIPFRLACCNGQVGNGTFGATQRLDFGSHRQRWALQAGQRSLGNSGAASQQSEKTTTRLHSKSERDKETEAVSQAYDILNAGPRNRFTANGLLVSNCKEGYNDCALGAVAIFRPVSKAASALAEQMKGRVSRPLKDLIEGVIDKDERLKLIAESELPNGLVIDLVGITGLGDCASTAMIYAEGTDDEILEKAEELLIDGEIEDVEEAVDTAERLVKEDRERIRHEREEAERRAREEYEKRAKADAEVKYSEYEMGVGENVDPNLATVKQYRFMRFLGMQIVDREVSKRQAGRMIDQLTSGGDLQDIAYSNGIEDKHWQRSRPSIKQVKWLQRKNVTNIEGWSPLDASNAISASKEPVEFERKFCGAMLEANDHSSLDYVGKQLQKVRATGLLGDDVYGRVVMAGRERRAALNGEDDF